MYVNLKFIVEREFRYNANKTMFRYEYVRDSSGKLKLMSMNEADAIYEDMVKLMPNSNISIIAVDENENNEELYRNR